MRPAIVITAPVWAGDSPTTRMKYSGPAVRKTPSASDSAKAARVSTVAVPPPGPTACRRLLSDMGPKNTHRPVVAWGPLLVLASRPLYWPFIENLLYGARS